MSINLFSVDCRVSQWGAWKCTGTCCADITEKRTRTVTVAQYGSGNSCPSLSEPRKVTYDSKACYIDYKCYAHKSLSTNGCKKCNREVSRYSWQLLSTTDCNDGSLCTKNDQCINGECKGTAYTCKSCQYCDGSGCPTRIGQCYIQSKCYKLNDPNPASKQCQVCDPYKGYNYKFYTLTGNACDDGDLCTKSDACSKDGLCVGTPFTCLADCQTCDGNNGCKTTKGCVTSGKCGCSIGGRCHAHGVINPDNQCQFCDIYTNADAWTNVADGKDCNDGDSCTRDDACQSGSCNGTSFTCTANQVCMQSSTCNGKDCTVVYRATTYRCYRSQDACDWSDQYCTGIATCPQSSLKEISGVKVALGTVSVLIFGISTATELSYKATESGKFYLMMTQNTGVRAKFNQFKVPCGGVTFSWQLVNEDIKTGVQKSITGIKTATSDGAGTKEVSATNLNLKNGGIYRVLVTASNVRGDSQKAQSNLILVDITPPTFTGAIRDGNSKVDVQYQSSTNILSAYWDPNEFSDPESGLDTASFQVGVGLQAYQTTVASFIAAKPSEGTVSNLKLQHNKRYYVTVSVANRAGLRGQAATNGVLIDTTSPVAGSVTLQDALGQTLTYQNTCSRQIRATIVNFKDDESGLDSFQWQLCRTPHNNPLKISCSENSYVDFVCSPGNNCKLDVYHPQDRMVENGCFVHSYIYQLYIRAKNRAGLSVDQTSNKITVDMEPPIKGVVTDGLTTDIDYQSDNQHLRASWTGFKDDVSGIDFYELAAFEEYGTAKQKTVVNYAKVSASGQWTSNKLSLVTGKTYSVTVKCHDKAGLITEVTSDGVLIDPIAPVPGQILDTDDRNLAQDVDYQVSTSKIETKWTKFTSASGIKSCKWAVSSSADVKNLGDVAAERTIPLTTRSYDMSIQLKPYAKYYASVRCTSNAGLTSTVAFSDGVTPDTSIPISGTVSDLCIDDCGSVDDTDYSSSTTALRFRWSGFNDPHSGIVEYEWNYAICGTNYYLMTDYLSAGLSASVLKTGLVLNHNQRYCVTVRATNAAGSKSSATSNGTLVDSTGPKGGVLQDGSSRSKDIDHQYNTRMLSYVWDLFVDSESSVESVTISVGSSPGLADVSPVRKLSTTATSATVGALLLRHNRVYYGTVCATNKARIQTCVRSDGVLIDSSPPDVGIVIDGLIQPDIDYQNNDHTISAHWYGFKDVESNIDKFQWGIGTSPNVTDISPFTDIGTNVTAKKTGLKLANGKRYYVTVNAFNPGGHRVTKDSDGVIVDTTPPVHPDPTQLTIQVTGTSVLKATWKGFTDPDSSIWFYKWAVGTTKCGTEIQAHTNVGRVTQGKLTGAKLVSGTTLYVSVLARNHADLTSHVCSNGYLLDVTPPKAGKVRDGLKGADLRFLSASDSVAGNWDQFEDVDSGVVTCYFGVGTSSSKVDVNGFVETGKVTSFTQRGLKLSQGVKYYVHIRCTNGVGLNTTETSDGALVDLTEPANGTVATAKYQVSLTEIRATWNGFVDLDSDIESYSWAIGSRPPPSSDIQSFIDVGPHQTGRTTSLSLTPYKTYYVSVRAYNKAGLYTTRYSDGVKVDDSPPIAGVVQDGQGAVDTEWLTDAKGIGAKWNGFHDPHSAIDYYRWAVGTNPKGTQLMDYTSVETTMAFCSECVFTSGSRYYVTVEAVNGAGLRTTVSSNGFAVDLTPPEVLPISGITWQRNGDLALEWLGGRDAESSPLQCWVLIAGIRQILLSKSTPHSVLINTTRLQTKDSINCSVQCVNKAGLKTTTASQVVDATPPSSGTLRATDIMEKAFSISWHGFEERETHIVYYEWSVSPCLNTTHTFTRVTQTKDYTALYTVPRGSSDSCFTVRLRAVNSVALISRDAILTVNLPHIERPPVDSCCDISVQYTRNMISAKWNWKTGFQRFSDNATYRWAVGTSLGRLLISPYTTTGALLQGSCTNCPIIQGSTYFVTVQASVDGFDTFISSQSAGVTIDFTKPEIGIVDDGSHDNEKDYFQVSGLYAVHWSDFRDYESKIRNCTVNVVDENANIVWKQTVTSSDGSGSLSDISVPWKSGQMYKSVVFCYNGASLVSRGQSNGFVVDGTPPTTGTVTFTIRRAPTGEAKINGAWTGFIDKESGIDYYEWSLSNATASQYVTEFENVGKNNAIIKHMALTSGLQYKLVVRARNAAGLESLTHSSGVVYDTTPPLLSYVYDGSDFHDVDYQADTTGISAFWGPTQDNETGIDRYEWAIGTEVGGEQVLPFVTTGLKLQGRCPECLLSAGAKYYITVMAVNGAGLKSTKSSNGIVVDDTPPTPGIIYDGIVVGKDINFQSDTTSLSCTWMNFTDKESHVSSYTVCFSRDGETCDVTDAQKVHSTINTFTYKYLRLVDSVTYYGVVTGMNGAGLVYTASSNGVLIDTTPPTAGYVYEGRGQDIDCMWINESLHVHWSHFHDEQSGIVNYEFAVGSKPDSNELLPFMSVGLATNATCNPSWSGDQIVYVTVAAYNEAGGRITASSDGIKGLIDSNGGIEPENCVSFGYINAPSA